MLRPVTLALLLVVTSTAHAQQQALTATDLTNLERISRLLLGTPARDVTRVGRQLAPFARTPGDVDHWTVLCTGQHCYATILLRADGPINVNYLHVPSMRDTQGQHDLRPDVVVRGNNRIEQVTLVRHGNVLFAVGRSFKPTASNHAMERTADRRTLHF